MPLIALDATATTCATAYDRLAISTVLDMGNSSPLDLRPTPTIVPYTIVIFGYLWIHVDKYRYTRRAVLWIGAALNKVFADLCTFTYVERYCRE
jgi:hypothetical protein